MQKKREKEERNKEPKTWKSKIEKIIKHKNNPIH